MEGREGRMVFFGKKNQKTFPRWSEPQRWNARGAASLSVRSTREKSFGSFLQKRTACFPSLI
jgi:hypothetical protein